jgi:transketolase
MEIVKRPHATNLVNWAKEKPEVVVFSADLTSSCEIDDFRSAYPDRFFSMGVAEQNMVSWAAGMAKEGFVPLVHTFAVFIYRQALHQIIVSVAYPYLPVKFFGFLPGILTPGGMTHQATEDIAVLRSIPNMVILECGDATEVESVLEVVYNIEGPVYVRTLRGEVPRLFPKEEPFEFDRARILSTGKDIAIFTSGICTEEALRVTAYLRQQGIEVQHLHISTHKPFEDPAIVEAISNAKYGVVTMENHTILGGLGSNVAEKIAELGLGKKLIRLGLKDVYAHGASRPYLMKKYQLDAMTLVRSVEALMEIRLNITEEELASVHLQPIHSSAKAEAL